MRRRLAPATSYATVVLLQLWVLRGIGTHRDVSVGDTADYFWRADLWHDHGMVDFAWSPLYTAFYGTWLFFTSDPVAATYGHRIALVLVVALLVHAVFRALVPPVWAWIGTAWWVVIPTHYDVAFEIHLFSLVPPLIAALIAARVRGSVGRGLALGVLVAGALLVRNELALLAALFAGICVLLELRESPAAARLARAYGLPLVAVALLVGGAYAQAVNKPGIEPSLRRKHTLNVCQVYAYGYQQRRHDWQGSPWTECQGLMRRVFGVPEPTIFEAIARRPVAIAGHAAWNARLLPQGVQTLIFGSGGWSSQPGFERVDVNSRRALALTALVGGVMVVGTIAIWRDRRRWWSELLRPNMAAWGLLAGVATVGGVVALVERPRPAYLLGLGIVTIAWAIQCARVLASRLSEGWWRHLPIAIAVGVGLLVVGWPPTYTAGYVDAVGNHVGRKLVTQIRNMLPYAEADPVQPPVIVAAQFPLETCQYVWADSRCRGYDVASLTAGGEGFAASVRARGVTHIYVDARLRQQLPTEIILSEPERAGWRVRAGAGSWRLIERVGGAAPAPAARSEGRP